MMKCKRLSILLSALFVMVLAVSFSVPVEASSVSSVWSSIRDGASGTVSKTASNVNFSQLLDSEVYFTNSSDSSTGSSFYYFTGEFLYYYWRVFTFPASSGYQYRIRDLVLSSTTPSGAMDQGMWCIGTDAQVLQGSAQYLSNRATGTTVTYAGEGVSLSLFYRLLVFSGRSDPDPSVTVSYSFSGVDSRFFATDASVNQALVDINSVLNSQTSSINNTITRQTQQQTNTLTGGYDNAGMENSNTQLSDSMNDYAAVEDQAMNQSVSYIDDVGFVSPVSNSSIFAAITFTSSWLQSLFNNMGDWSLLILVSLSLALGLMLIGWFKYR